MLLDLYWDIARGLKTDRVSGVGAMIKGIIPGTDRTNSYCVIYCPDVLRTYQRALHWLNSCEMWIGKGWKKEKWMKRYHFAMASLCKDFLKWKIYTFFFTSPFLLCLERKLSSFFAMGYTGRCRSIVKDI